MQGQRQPRNFSLLRGQATANDTRGKGCCEGGQPCHPPAAAEDPPHSDQRVGSLRQCLHAKSTPKGDTAIHTPGPLTPLHHSTGSDPPAIAQTKPESMHCSKRCPPPQQRGELSHGQHAHPRKPGTHSWAQQHCSQQLLRTSIFLGTLSRRQPEGTGWPDRDQQASGWEPEHGVGLAHEQECPRLKGSHHISGPQET